MSVPGRTWRAEPRALVERPAAAVEHVGRWLTSWASDPRTRHSRFVALLRRLLPAIGIALLMLIAIWPRLAPFWERMRFAFPAIDLRDARELDMINPRYVGIDREGRPFVVTAVSARQLPDRQDLVSLKAPRADMKSHSGANIVINAHTGIYQSQTQMLDLFDDVTVVHQNGTKFVTQAARVNVANSSAEGSKPVTGHGPSGDVQAEGFRLLDRGDKIIFTGKSDLLLRGKSGATPDGSPKTVSAAPTAAPAAAQAKPHLVSIGRVPAARAVPAVSRRPIAERSRPVHRREVRRPLHHAEPHAGRS